jgi:phage terminase large subunit
MTIELPHRYTPRDYQIPAWRAMDDKKRVLLVWHRRGGKDKLCFNKLITIAAQKPANYAYYFPTAALGRKALWFNVDVANGMRVIDHIPKELLAKPPNQTDMRIEIKNGSTIQILGTDNLDVVGGNYYGVVFSEYQSQNPLAWDYTRPILAENGGFAWFNGTPRGENHMHAMLTTNRTNEDWFTQVLTVEDTGAVSKEDIEAERRSGMSEALIQQEFYCDFNIANENAIYGSYMAKVDKEGRIGAFPVDGRSPVHTFWDLGGPRNTVVWYGQRLPHGCWRWVDVDYGLNVTLPERFAHMQGKGYTYGKHYFPHDARQTARTGFTFEQDAINAGFKNTVVVPPIHDVWQGIDYVAQVFPTFEFRLPACEIGVKGLKAYESAPDTTSNIVRNVPLHTWASHVADGVRTMAEAEVLGLIPAAVTGGTGRRVRFTDDDDKPRVRVAKFEFQGMKR